jgi:hypothetical protein
MGYFSNGTEGYDYEDRYCRRCANYRDKSDTGSETCPIIDAHKLYNYDECNKPDSILHILIPFKKEGLGNDECAMFLEKK